MDINNVVALDPLVLLLPDAKVSTMAKLLTWSIKGLVNIAKQELESVTSTLHALQVNMDIFQITKAACLKTTKDSSSRKLTKQTSESTTKSPSKLPSKLPQEPEVQSIDDDDDDEVICCDDIQSVQVAAAAKGKQQPFSDSSKKRSESKARSDSKPRSDLKSRSESKPNSKVKPISDHPGDHGKTTSVSDKKLDVVSNSKTNEIKCPEASCSMKFSGIHKLKAHLARNHFREELLKLANTPSDSKECGLCHKTMVNTYSLAGHIGTTHGGFKKILPSSHLRLLYPTKPPIKKKMIKAKRAKVKVAKPKVANAKPKRPLLVRPDFAQQSSLNAGETMAKLDIEYCGMCSEYCPRDTFSRHLARSHYKDDLLRLSGCSGSDACGICGIEVSSCRGAGLRDAEMAEHVGLAHNLLDKVMKVEEEEEAVGEEDPFELVYV